MQGNSNGEQAAACKFYFGGGDGRGFCGGGAPVCHVGRVCPLVEAATCAEEGAD